MSYDKKTWMRRMAERSDLSSQIVHLTRERTDPDKRSPTEVLFDIVDQRRIIGSTTDKGFICGKTRAVCFQDAPLTGICQNVFYEQKYKEQNGNAKIRYRAMGIALSKDVAYSKGARPVIYDQTSEAKKFLPETHWWRIVNFDLSDANRIVDWSHEREWRCPGDFVFDLDEITLLFVREESYRTFVKLCKKNGKSYLEQVKGVVVMDNLLY